MNFLLSLYTKDNCYRNFTIQGVSLETGLDFVNTIVNQGDQLKAVRCLDQNSYIELPAHVFDGESFTQSLSALQQEWEQLLTQPRAMSGPAKTALGDWPMRVDQTKQMQIAHLQECHWQIQMLAERAELRLREGKYKTNLLRHYERLLHHFSGSLAKVVA
ncbi:hypothetical protein GCM10028805_00530 [Spirosoma harenae]